MIIETMVLPVFPEVVKNMEGTVGQGEMFRCPVFCLFCTARKE